MQAHERTSGTSHYETCSLICIAAPITRLFCGERSEHSALVWRKLILHFTCHFGQLNWCLLHKQLFLSTVESNQKSSRRKSKWGTSSEKSRKAIYQMLPDCSSSLSCVFHTPSWQKKEVLLKKSPHDKTNISITKQRLTHTFSDSLFQWWSTLLFQTLCLC